MHAPADTFASSFLSRAPDAPAGVGSRADVELRVVRSTGELDALEPAWEALQEACGARVFQSFAWQRAWWRHLGERQPSRELLVLVATADDRVVAIAPLFVETLRPLGLLRLRRIAFLGTGLTDYLDVLVAQGFEGRSLERFAGYLAENGSRRDVVSLCDIPDASPTGALLVEALRRRGFTGAAFVSERCPRTHLKGTWQETLDSFEGGHRRHLAKRVRQLSSAFKVELEIARNDETLARDVDEFMSMHQRRWSGIGKRGVYADAQVVEFQREIARAFFRRGWLFLAFLRVDGRRVAALCGFKHRGELAYYLGGVGDVGEVSRYSPGLVLHALCMQELIAEGVGIYDFLRGTERYKYACGAVDVPNWTILMFRGELSKPAHAIALLQESLARRIGDERRAFAHQRRLHGLLSRQMAKYVGRRLFTTLRDGLKKLRSPEKSLSADE